jgi:hypothetical protein
MALEILAAGIARELPNDVAEELVERLKQGGLVERNPATGEIVNRSPMAELADRLVDAKNEGAIYAPRPDEQAILFAVLQTWLGDVTTRRFPESGMVLRYALFCDIDDRQRGANSG